MDKQNTVTLVKTALAAVVAALVGSGLVPEGWGGWLLAIFN